MMKLYTEFRSHKILKDGDIISIDIGVIKNGFFGDAAITVAVGNINDEKKKLMDVTERSLYLGIEQAVTGNRVHDISSAVQTYVESNGFSVVKRFMWSWCWKILTRRSFNS